MAVHGDLGNPNTLWTAAQGVDTAIPGNQRPGIFAVGDVRSGSVKRAATAIGESSMAVRLVFEGLQAIGSAVTDPPRGGPDSRNAAVPTAKEPP
jgi:hypothetical protein